MDLEWHFLRGKGERVCAQEIGGVPNPNQNLKIAPFFV